MERTHLPIQKRSKRKNEGEGFTRHTAQEGRLAYPCEQETTQMPRPKLNSDRASFRPFVRGKVCSLVRCNTSEPYAANYRASDAEDKEVGKPQGGTEEWVVRWG